MHSTRNTRTERRCPTCQGTGAYELPARDPRLDTFTTCPHAGCNEGWIRWAPLDPMELLKQARQHARSAFGATRYGEIRQRAVSPVHLPADRKSVDELAADAERAIQQWQAAA